MTQKIQWTIKGISPETRELSRSAAKKSGMKLSFWVETALTAAANKPTNQEPQSIEVQHLLELIERQNTQIAAMQADIHLLYRAVLNQKVPPATLPEK